MAAAVDANRLYAIGCVCLLIAAAALRFYNLPSNSLWYDEAVTSIHSRGDFSDVINNNRYGISSVTRYGTNAPILYPIALWAVQKVESSNFSVRLASAVGGVLTVGALLFVMPRLGVARAAAFLAALLAALSIGAIEEAQYAGVHSVSALCAALLIAGTLQYARNGGRALLCISVFIAPLLHYGLVPFGAAALAAAALAPPAAAQTLGGRRTWIGAVWGWVKRRFGLIPPSVCFAAACVICWGITTRYQWTGGGWARGSYLADFYYQGGYDAAGIIGFALTRGWGLLIYHMPPITAAAALLAFGALLLGLLIRRRRDAVALMALVAFGASAVAALLGAYPFGGSRHNLYMGPLIFLAAGVAFHWVVVNAGAIARRKRVAPVLGLAAAVGIVVAGAAAIWQSDLYDTDASIERVLAALDERAREGDAVYVSRWSVPPVAFYKREKPSNYFYDQTPCPGTYGTSPNCVQETFGEMFKALNGARRIWLIYNTDVSVAQEMAAYSQDVAVEAVDARGWTTLHLITGFEGLAADIREEWLDVYDAAAAEPPSFASTYNLHIRGDALYYVKRPCAASDGDGRFFLHVYPSDGADTGVSRWGRGFDNLDFNFHHYGIRVDDRCIARRALPGYPIERIHTGQFVPGGGVVWEAEFPFKP